MNGKGFGRKNSQDTKRMTEATKTESQDSRSADRDFKLGLCRDEAGCCPVAPRVRRCWSLSCAPTGSSNIVRKLGIARTRTDVIIFAEIHDRHLNLRLDVSERKLWMRPKTINIQQRLWLKWILGRYSVIMFDKFSFSILWSALRNDTLVMPFVQLLLE
jgi:hypothetical protein